MKYNRIEALQAHVIFLDLSYISLVHALQNHYYSVKYKTMLNITMYL